MQDLNDLYYYAEVVEHGGFSAAARVLGLPKSKLSRRLALLEERLGVRLIQRSTRRFAVTDVGRTYYEHCKAMLEEARAAQESIDLTRAEPRGVVRITCPVALLQETVSAMLADFMVTCPLVSIHLEATNRRVDPVAEAIDIAIRVRPPPLQDSDLVLKILGNRCQCLVASPELIAQQGEVNTPADLTGWPSLALGQPQQAFIWDLAGPEGAQARIYHQPRLVTADMTTLRSAALRGVGVVQLPVMMVTDPLATGALIHLLPDWTLRHGIIHAVFPSRRGLLPSVRAVLDYLELRFSQLDDQ
ncbi:bacterial regulatory helix-turn-helix, lysR family protein [Yersinia rohdei]|uniref:Bacterial regulatory helix-turn-helix, lysR family protein n=1 Tax=Yersinia rohdei TaxID=29485 RepID=A0ABN4EYG6_YERRO|nr:LysR family transcriptional regulator [Yersinia rohdei]AJJ09653.1 bacterial regulatory helix-turn-helix, lysR family protein [Yersinia rohdei]EEQ02422.1 LysR-family transcriptional regulator [Yersinia rohdei ATCC 43380]